MASAFGGQRSIQLSYGCLGQGNGRLAKGGQGGQTYNPGGGRGRAGRLAAAFVRASSSLPGAGVLGW